ncbi:hypothetical protein QA612_21420 [Evansella sp. AB-P1]|uniref:DUF6612 family protein n=1 Tax=Evansella sp. AB-P1 TaxID=3037653 RepID=UPI00241C2825|nr:DUF6612 family protein [Evansella sp. AB-P1]MDG5790020.1 hypothetical protein [Evansella sp. AB-P1]
MKKFMFFTFSLFLAILVACSENSSTNEVNENENENNLEQNENNNESNDNLNNNQIEDEKNVLEEIEAEMENNENNEEEVDIEVAGGDAESILQKSAAAMSDVFSYVTEGKFIVTTEAEDYNMREEITILMEMILSEKPMMFTQTSTKSDYEEYDIDMYLVDGHVYVYDDIDDLWYTMPTDNDLFEIYDMFNVMDSSQLDEYIEMSSTFEVIDSGDHYKLTYASEDDDLFSFLTGSAIVDMEIDYIFSVYENIEGRGMFEILIDKETYHLLSYTLELDLKSDYMGEMETYYIANYTYSNFNEVDDIVVPDEVVDQAVSMFGDLQ